VREADGLALSSRNRFLTAEERKTAPALRAAMVVTIERLLGGDAVAAALAAGVARLGKAGLRPDYFALVHAHSLAPLAVVEGPARLIAAAKLGRIRLLDNASVG